MTDDVTREDTAIIVAALNFLSPTGWHFLELRNDNLRKRKLWQITFIKGLHGRRVRGEGSSLYEAVLNAKFLIAALEAVDQ